MSIDIAPDAITYSAEPLESAQTILSAWQAAHPGGGMLLFVAEADRAKIPALQQIACDCGIDLVGAMFPELLFDGEFRRQGALFLGQHEKPEYCLCSPLSQSDPEAIAERLAILSSQCGSDGEDSLFMIFDGMVPNIASILDAVYRHIGDQVNYMGVNAGSETFQPMPCLFTEAGFVGDAVLTMVLHGHPGAILEHGYPIPDHAMMATSVTGNRIAQIDWVPAFDAYARLIREHYGVEVTRENFYEYGVHFPFGILRAEEQPLVRIPVALEEDGSLFCVGEVPEHAMIALLQAVAPGTAETVEAIARWPGLGGKQDALGFYCAGRRMHLGDAAAAELKLWSDSLGSHRLAGALSLGEIGSHQRGGYPLFHNATLVMSPWPDA